MVESRIACDSLDRVVQFMRREAANLPPGETTETLARRYERSAEILTCLSAILRQTTQRVG